MCPRCQDARLHPTGAFWLCAACGLAITQQALRVERAEAEPGARPRRTGRSEPAQGVAFSDESA